MTDLAIAVLKKNATAAEGQMLALCVDPRDILNLIARIEKAEGEAAKWRETCRDAVNEGMRHCGENARLRALLERSGEALTFYGDASKYPPQVTGDMADPFPENLWSDCGARARAIVCKIDEATR